MRMIGETGTGSAIVEMEMAEVEQFRVALHTLETMTAALSSMRVLRVGGTDGAALMGELPRPQVEPPRVDVDRRPAPELAPKKTVRGKKARVPVAKTSAGPMRDKVCLGCGKAFRDETTTNCKKTCSDACRQVVEKKRNQKYYTRATKKKSAPAPVVLATPAGVAAKDGAIDRVAMLKQLRAKLDAGGPVAKP